LCEVGFEHVRAHDFEARLARELEMKALGQERIHLDGHYPRGALQQLFGQSTSARADFHDQILARGAGGRGDALEDGSPDEEMLSEFAAWHASAVSPAR
jgi:hypothetical protein